MEIVTKKITTKRVQGSMAENINAFLVHHNQRMLRYAFTRNQAKMERERER